LEAAISGLVITSTNQTLLDSVGSGTTEVTVSPPANAASLLIFMYAGPAEIEVQGATTGAIYPVTASPPFGGVPAYLYAANIVQAIDSSFIVLVNTTGGHPWWVVSDTAIRTIAACFGAEGQTNLSAPSLAMAIAGVDTGSNLQVMPCIVPGESVTGANVLPVGGADINSDARTLITNSVGQLLPGAATNPSAGQVAILTTATPIASTRTGRTGLTIHNLSTSPGVVFIGPSNTITITANSHAIEPGHSQTVASQVQWYGVAAATGSTVTYVDE
jgi:hypothetical protein